MRHVFTVQREIKLSLANLDETGKGPFSINPVAHVSSLRPKGRTIYFQCCSNQ